MPATSIANQLTRDLIQQRIWEQYKDVLPTMAQMYNLFPLPKDPTVLDVEVQRIKMRRYMQYLTSKVARPYFLPITFTFAGVAGQQVTLNTTGVNGRLIVVKATTNAATTFLVGVKETYTNRLLQSTLVPPTSLFSNTTNTTEKYFTFPAPLVLENNATLELTIRDTVGSTQSTWFVFWCIWCPDEQFVSGNEWDRQLDEYVLDSIRSDTDYRRAKPFVLDMRVPFTTTAGERVVGTTQQQQEPLLIYGIQQNLVTKNAAFIAGGLTANFQDLATNYLWATQEIPLWAFADFVTEPEQYMPFPYPLLVRPGTQMRGFFTNMSGGDEIGANDIQFICGTP